MPNQLLLAAQASYSETPPLLQAISDVMDPTFNAVFFMEFVLKVIALGWYSTGRSAYIRNPWNVADCVLLLGSCLCTCIMSARRMCLQ